MIQKMKVKANNKKGFTLAELLIVVAILAVLVAIAIPVFNSSLTKAKDAVRDANLRAAKAEATVAYLEGQYNGGTAQTNGEITLDENGTPVVYTWEYKDGKIAVAKKGS